MKELHQYQCEVCGTVYSSERIAMECEGSHKIIENVEPVKYRSMKSDPDGYPDQIKVTFNNHSTLIYKR